MRCKEAQAKSSVYLDGDLSDEESSAVRGHLRQCPGCQRSFEQEALLLEAAANLAPLEPPDRVWEGISQKIAEAEIADSHQHVGWRWLGGHYKTLGAVGLVACAATAVVLMMVKGSAKPGPEPLEVAGTASSSAVRSDAESTVAQVAEKALSEADRDYLQTIEELRQMLEEDRKGWSDVSATAIDAKLAGFRRAAIEQRFALADEPILVSSRDSIYAGYRAEISFLQSALAGDLPGAGAQP